MNKTGIGKESRDVLLKLLAESLWSGEEPADIGVHAEEVWNGAYSLARRHSVAGLMFDSARLLPRECGMGRGLKARMLSHVAEIESSYDRMSAVIASQKNVWEHCGIDAVLMKGHGLAAMYPVPSHRSCGDIDWWMKTGADWDKACGLLEEKHIVATYDSDGDIHYVVGGIVVEHHRRGYEAPGIPGLLLYLNRHILRHAMVLGVGLKQFCDLGVAYRHLAGKYDVEELRGLLEKKGLLKWTDLLHSFLVERMYLPESFLPFPVSGTLRRKDLDMLEAMVMRDGHFGQSRRHKFIPTLLRSSFFMCLVPHHVMKRYNGLLWGRLTRKR